MVEDKILELLADINHVYTMITIFSVLTILRYTGPVAKFLFSDKWKWLVTPINLALASLCIFGFGMTSFKTMGGKVLITLLITAVTIMAYEAILKYVVRLVETKILKKTKKLNGG
jgi:hypothetical protein